MSKRTDTRVECPLCGEEFDPSAAGGWCTNSDCGEWQYDEAGSGSGGPGTDGRPTDGPDAETGDSAASGESAAAVDSTQPASDDRTGAAASANDRRPPAGDGESNPGSESGADGNTAEPAETAADPLDGSTEDRGAVETRGAEPEPSGTTAERPELSETSTEPESSEPSVAADEGSESTGTTDERPEPLAATDGEPDPSGTADREPEPPADSAADSPSCPTCDAPVDPDANFCPQCGTDLPDLDAGRLDECPSCGVDVDEDDNFCAQCGEDLDAHRGESATRAGADDAEATGDDAVAGQGRAADGRDDAGSAAGAEPAADGSERADAAGRESAPESLTLALRGREIDVSDGDTVGREIRSVLTETGGDEDQAVRVHREHLRFVREDGRFHVVDLGENPTRVNGRRLEKGDRVPVEAGDSIELSGVAQIRVETP